MRFFWKRLQRSPQPPVDRLQFVVQDFLKLFAYAVASGAAFSALAIAVTLAVSRNSEAQVRTAESGWVKSGDHQSMFVLEGEAGASTAFADMATETADANVVEHDDTITPTPGSLYVGDGCEGVPLMPIEREWFVSIKGDVATVQVQQAFAVPAMYQQANDNGDDTREAFSGPWFHALLPKGAQFISLTVDAQHGRRIGRWIGEVDRDDNDQPLKNGDIRTYTYAGGDVTSLSSEPITALLEGETVVVTYQYQMLVASSGAGRQLRLVLAAEDVDETSDQPTTPLPAGAVWVEWRDAVAPTLQRVPVGASVERRRGNIVGLSWASQHISPSEEFVLGWK